jgi:hypothetical protein
LASETVTKTGLKVQLVSKSMGDIAAMAEMGKTKEDITNAFHVPLAFLTTQTNLANLQAAEHQHTAKAINPGLQRRDEKLNEQLIPRRAASFWRPRIRPGSIRSEPGRR